MKNERILRKRIAIYYGCSDWDGRQGLCMQIENCGCLKEARQRLEANNGELPDFYADPKTSIKREETND